MELADVLPTAESEGSDDEDTTYRCVGCMPTFEEHRGPCPECSSEAPEAI